MQAINFKGLFSNKVDRPEMGPRFQAPVLEDERFQLEHKPVFADGQDKFVKFGGSCCG